MTQSTEQTRRAEYIAGLRAVADLLDSAPDLPLPTTPKIEWAVHYYAVSDEAQRAVLATIARLIPGRLDKNDPAEGQYAANYFTLSGNVGGMPVEVWAERPSVCERVVTGTREVTKVVPTATEEVTVTEDVVEWICTPLLADAVSA